jgi:hypothetical protein
MTGHAERRLHCLHDDVHPKSPAQDIADAQLPGPILYLNGSLASADDNRKMGRLCTDLRQHLQARLAEQTEIQQDQGRGALMKELQGLFPRTGGDPFIAIGMEDALDDVAELMIGIGNQDQGHASLSL